MKQFTISIIMLELSMKIGSLFTSVECPAELQKDIAQYGKPKLLQISCTMQLLCPRLIKKSTDYKNRDHGYQVHEHNPDGEPMCEIKLKINVVRDLSARTRKENPCAELAYHKDPVLLPHSTNCSLFYKCDWNTPMLFECPEELHFNPILQVCDWSWQARCDLSWISCPRPPPRCPTRYPGLLLLPHPYLCDRFYRCNWGTAQLQTCPTGLYFNPRLKVCDWPYNSNCQTC